VHRILKVHLLDNQACNLASKNKDHQTGAKNNMTVLLNTAICGEKGMLKR